jgi:phosphatidylserine/phosphatidylglycerophosphate/cardiolipin synthase-like enzyme
MLWYKDTGLYDQNSFYDAFMKDVTRSRKRVIIESPFITTKRINQFSSILGRLVQNGVVVIVNTKPIEEHDALLRDMAYEGVATLQDVGVQVLFTAGHHRKLAVIDEETLWEGSLSILSQNDSCEVMRRIRSKQITGQMLEFLHLDRFYEVN